MNRYGKIKFLTIFILGTLLSYGLAKGQVWLYATQLTHGVCTK